MCCTSSVLRQSHLTSRAGFPPCASGSPQIHTLGSSLSVVLSTLPCPVPFFERSRICSLFVLRCRTRCAACRWLCDVPVTRSDGGSWGPPALAPRAAVLWRGGRRIGSLGCCFAGSDMGGVCRSRQCIKAPRYHVDRRNKRAAVSPDCQGVDELGVNRNRRGRAAADLPGGGGWGSSPRARAARRGRGEPNWIPERQTKHNPLLRSVKLSNG